MGHGIGCSGAFVILCPCQYCRGNRRVLKAYWQDVTGCRSGRGQGSWGEGRGGENNSPEMNYWVAKRKDVLIYATRTKCQHWFEYSWNNTTDRFSVKDIVLRQLGDISRQYNISLIFLCLICLACSVLHDIISIWCKGVRFAVRFLRRLPKIQFIPDTAQNSLCFPLISCEVLFINYFSTVQHKWYISRLSWLQYSKNGIEQSDILILMRTVECWWMWKIFHTTCSLHLPF